MSGEQMFGDTLHARPSKFCGDRPPAVALTAADRPTDPLPAPPSGRADRAGDGGLSGDRSSSFDGRTSSPRSSG